MERENSEALACIELGTVSRDTLGDGGIYWEGFDHEPATGISDD